VVGESIYDLYRDYPQVIANIDRCLAGEEFSATIEVGRVSFEAHYTPVRNAQGEVTGLFGVATDITERKDLEAQLRHAQKMEAVGRLAGGVAHDFNNLLTVIQGHSQVMLAKMPPTDTLRASAEEIQKAGARGVLLTRQLLAFSRKQILAPTVLELNEVVAGLMDILHRLIGEQIELVFRPGGVGKCRLDRGQMEQVLVNLVVNARDAMPQGGRITLETSDIELDEVSARQLGAAAGTGYVMLAVTDTGTGMDEHTRSRIFEPFFTTKEVGKGTGLGLATVYGIVQQSGGNIRVESELGVGTTFTLYFPRVEEAVTATETGNEAPRPGTETVLVVDDEGEVQALVQVRLHRARHRAPHGGGEDRRAASGNHPPLAHRHGHAGDEWPDARATTPRAPAGHGGALHVGLCRLHRRLGSRARLAAEAIHPRGSSPSGPGGSGRGPGADGVAPLLGLLGPGPFQDPECPLRGSLRSRGTRR
jgi:signal transduction histidine kinase